MTVLTREQAAAAARLRRLAARAAAPDPTPQERCDLCGVDIPDEHAHLVHTQERRIVCACEACRALLSGEGAYRPTGTRTLWLADLDLPDELWSGFRIPIGLAFLFVSSVTGGPVACYPSPAGATESELELDAWDELLERNPPLEELVPDVEALLVNRLAEPPQHALVPIDACYRLVGLVKASWEGFSGGDRVRAAVDGFFAELREGAAR